LAQTSRVTVRIIRTDEELMAAPWTSMVALLGLLMAID